MVLWSRSARQVASQQVRRSAGRLSRKGPPVDENSPASSASYRTGNPEADVALDRLAELAGTPPAEQVSGYDEVHRRLRDALVDLPED